MSSSNYAATQNRLSPNFDPQSQPVVKLADSDLLLPDSIRLDFIREAFRQPVSWQVEPIFAESFSSYCSKEHALLRHAAVFMPLIQRGPDVHVLFTKRTEHLSDHAGQICFPGGSTDPSDKSEIETALRETHEEIGVSREYIQLIGTQPAYITVSQFLMTPVVGVLKPGFKITPDTNEVAEVFEVPLQVLLDPRKHRLHKLPAKIGNERYYFSMQWENHFIWGATAALIRNFYHFMVAAQKTLK